MGNDIELTDEQALQERLTLHWISPEYEFQGQELAPFSAGTQALWRQIIDNDDKFSIYSSYLIYLLIEYKKDRSKIRKLCFKKEEFRELAQDWLDGLPRTSLEELGTLAASLFKEVDEATVVVAPENNSGPQKKITTPAESLAQLV